ncbi:elongation factor P maturation arginine rhamnosyltransferase EarP [Oxalobacter sp. OttesenSCG-928-P03]|nr:elongation factor P maturation arginine rhamnosyltransferase EarP [Oxalobacter sp. OttesenSCG-928-P03]
MKFAFSLDLFCHVVDNMGDAGVCWRLARQLAREYPVQVNLRIDRVEVLQKICPDIDPGKSVQQVAGVTVTHWPETFPDVPPSSIPDVVVEGFGCRLPDNYVSAMARRSPAPVWINMEYLSAEAWVNDCHGMASPHPSFPLTKYFLFPGFTRQTGGLLREAALFDECRRFQEDEANRRAFFRRAGVEGDADVVISLFCYEDAPVTALFASLAQQKERQVRCLVPEGVAAVQVSRFLGEPAVPGARRTEGRLTVQVIPLVEQDEYDRLLWSCDLNFVRGEDSFVRAQWAARPFVWQIYPQDEGAHMVKLDAFLGHYLSGASPEMAEAVRGAWYGWNAAVSPEAGDAFLPGDKLCAMLPQLRAYCVKWADEQAKIEDFASSLVRFISSLR